jgi:hypothetical protein
MPLVRQRQKGRYGGEIVAQAPVGTPAVKPC